MKYFIFSGQFGALDINRDEFKKLDIAITNLFECLFIEEKLDFVIENFFEYEVELLKIASRRMIFLDDDYFSMSHERNVVSRRIVNLLTSCKMYLDQSIKHITRIYGKGSPESILVEHEFNLQYNQSFGYRVMEALRNYTQHYGFPIQNIIFSSEWLDFENKDRSRLQFIVVPLIEVSRLAEDGKFKRSVLDEMLSFDKSNKGIDIRELIRDYIEGIGEIQEKIRNITRSDISDWECIIEDAIRDYKDKYEIENRIPQLTIIAQDENQVHIKRRSLFKEFIKKRETLERKNQSFGNFKKRYASNEIRNINGLTD